MCDPLVFIPFIWEQAVTRVGKGVGWDRSIVCIVHKTRYIDTHAGRLCSGPLFPFNHALLSGFIHTTITLLFPIYFILYLSSLLSTFTSFFTASRQQWPLTRFLHVVLHVGGHRRDTNKQCTNNNSNNNALLHFWIHVSFCIVHSSLHFDVFGHTLFF